VTDWLQELLETPPTPDAPRDDRPDVAASEVADYMFCGRAWWLRRETGPPAEASAALEDGTRRHALASQAIAVAETTGLFERTVQWAVVGAAIIAAFVVALLLGGR
jgi:hypothetical protein